MEKPVTINKYHMGIRNVINKYMSREIKFLLFTTIIMAVIGYTVIPSSWKNKTGKDSLASLSKATAWINSKPLGVADLKGKVVLINFCTYTCINWLRTLPYVRTWANKYKDEGLVVIAVHTPEFPFEKNITNVQSAMKAMDINYPVALDNDYTIWNAFNNQYWPALYLIDAKGVIRHQQFGEGGYGESEKMILQLLSENGNKPINKEIVPVTGSGIEFAADWDNLRSGENYLGYERTLNFVSYGKAAADETNNYTPPGKLYLNEWALAGWWTIRKGSVTLNKKSGSIIYRFHARDVHLVMGPAIPGMNIRFRVLIDGQAPGTDHGTDIDKDGYGTVNAQRLYQLARLQTAVSEHQIEIEFMDPGIEAFAFTFG